MMRRKGSDFAIINKYTIEGDITKIHIVRRNGDKFDTLIDTDCLQKLIKLNLPWHVIYERKVKGYYAAATEYLGYVDGKPKYNTLYLARVICDCKTNDDICVDHETHDTLDNRKENLRISINIENTKNRKGKNSNNTSGYRNVSKMWGKWCVQMQVNGKNTCLKKFPLDQLEEAGAYAVIMREKYYGEFKGYA